VGYWRALIIVCSSCQAQYSVPDAKVQGRKVRVTCKHCKNPFIVDGLALPKPTADLSVLAQLPAPFEVPAAPDDDATRVMQRPTDFSVHEEPTVIGQIPAEALEAERRFSQRTVPPPKEETIIVHPSVPSMPAAPVSPMALREDVPESPMDATRGASPQGIRKSLPSLAPPSPELKTMLSRTDPPPSRSWPWLLAALALLGVMLWLTLKR
jgi:predicted Zn finger-like uncharacterized protein